MKIASHAWLEIALWENFFIYGLFCACRYFYIKCCSARRLTTIDFKELLYLIFLFFFFLLQLKFFLFIIIIYVV